MNKKAVQTIISVALGIAVFIIVATVISMVFDVIVAKDPITLSVLDSENAKKVIGYIMYSTIGVICVIVPMLVCYCLTYFTSNKKIFGIISAALTFVLIVMCVVFIFDLRAFVLKQDSTTLYTAATAYFTELVKLIVSCLLTCAYFTVMTVLEFKNSPAARPSPTERPETAQNGGSDNE